MTPRGLVKVMNHYFTVMSGPIRSNRGVIDKYIGDAVMAYWGPPFIDEDEPALLAGLAAIDMVRTNCKHARQGRRRISHKINPA